MVSIVFFGIVKNESAIIKRCLEALKPIIDYVVITDTGSTDNTVGMIREWLDSNQLEGEVYHDEWKNFGINRTQSYKNAQEWIGKKGLVPTSTYLLTTDADMSLVIEPEFKKSDLDLCDHWLVKQKTSQLEFYNSRIFRSSVDFKSISVTHEYWGCDGNPSQGKMDTLYFNDIGDGGAKADKYDRDIRLLEQGIKDEPQNERYYFYLAQSYECKGLIDKAIEYYERRCVLKGWYEEVFIAMKRLGEMYLRKIQKPEEKDTEETVIKKMIEGSLYNSRANSSWLMAYEMCPHRSETLYKLINNLRNTGKNNLCSLYLKTALKIPFPRNDLLFIEHEVYDFKLLEELTIIGFYTDLKKVGRYACDYLILNPKIPSFFKESVRQNQFYYIEKLKGKDHQKITQGKVEDNEYITSSSCLFPTSKYNLEGTIRAVNYSITKEFQYKIRDPNNVVRTKNYWGKVDLKNIENNEYYEIVNLDVPLRKSHINGLEDLRITGANGKFYGLAVDWEFGNNNHPSVVVTRLEKIQDKMTVTKVIPTKYRDNECQKNWSPFMVYNKLYCIYSHHPLRILEINPNTGDCEVVIEKYTHLNLSNIRGSACPLQLDDGSWLVAVHEVVHKETRKYFHRLLKYNKDWDLIDISLPFYFGELFVEFTLSIYIIDGELSFVYSTEDNTTEKISIPIEEIEWFPKDFPSWLNKNL